MIIYTNLNELISAKQAIEKMKQDYPALYAKLVHTIYLTRALQFKYHYMGCLLMDKDSGEASPHFVYDSVLQLYKNEIQKLKDDKDFEVLKQLIAKVSNTNFSKLCLLILGTKPESLVGVSNVI
ncbi:MAG TPA: hypothetical protein GX497_02690 [Bacillus bacterium]|nr:hypothetical protein [Bacillus sp. (in: firmicutes)]